MINKVISKYKNTSDSVKCSIYFFVCNIFQKGIAFITVPIFTRLMSTEEYGQFTVFQSWNQVIIILTSWNLAYGTLNKALTKYDSHDEYVSAAQGLYTLNTFGVFVFYYCLKSVIGNFLNLPTYIEILLIIETICTPALAMFTVKSRYELIYRIPVFITMLLTAANPAIGIALVMRMTEKGIGRILGYLMAQIIICVPIYLYNFAKGKCLFNKEYWNYTFHFAIPLIPYFLSTIVLNQSDKIMISKLCGDSYAGIYGIAFSLAMLLRIINESVNASFVPWMYKRLKYNETHSIKGLTATIIAVITTLNMVVILFAPELVTLIGSSKYSDAIGIMPILTFSVCLMFQTSLFNNIEMYYEKNKVIMTASMVLSILNIILNYWFINLYGYRAAAYTTLFCYLLMLVWHIVYTYNAIPAIKGYVSIKAIVYSNVIIACFIIIMPLIQNSVLIRGILLIGVLTIGGLKTKDFIRRIKG